MNVVDSSAWLAYVEGGPNAEAFAPAIEDLDRLVVPSICLLEVFRRMHAQRGEGAALEVAAAMMDGRVVDLDGPLTITAARVGRETGLPLADSIVYTTALAEDATVWTQDADFEGLENVRYVPKRG